MPLATEPVQHGYVEKWGDWPFSSFPGIWRTRAVHGSRLSGVSILC